MADLTAFDDWTGEADLDAISPEAELAFIDERLKALARDGSVSHDVATQRIDSLMARLRAR